LLEWLDRVSERSKMNKRLSQVQKIVLSAMFLALAIGLTYFAKLIQPNGGYLRFSLTPAVIIFSSIIVGPFYGCLVGAASDLLPAIIIPQGQINFLITIAYGLLGLVPFFLMKLAVLMKEFGKKPYIVWGTFVITFIAIGAILFKTTWVESSFWKDGGYKSFFGSSELTIKALALLVLTVAFVVTCVMLHFLDKALKKRNSDVSVYQIAFVCLVSELLFMVLAKSLAFYFFYGFISEGATGSFFFWGPFAVLVIAIPVNVLLEVVVNCNLIPLADKLIKPRGSKDAK